MLCNAMLCYVYTRTMSCHYVTLCCYVRMSRWADRYLPTYTCIVCMCIYICMYVCVYMHIVPKPNCGISHGNISPDILICRSLLRLRCPESFQLHRPFGGTQLAHTHTHKQTDRQTDRHSLSYAARRW